MINKNHPTTVARVGCIVGGVMKLRATADETVEVIPVLPDEVHAHIQSTTAHPEASDSHRAGSVLPAREDQIKPLFDNSRDALLVMNNVTALLIAGGSLELLCSGEHGVARDIELVLLDEFHEVVDSTTRREVGGGWGIGRRSRLGFYLKPTPKKLLQRRLGDSPRSDLGEEFLQLVGRRTFRWPASGMRQVSHRTPSFLPRRL